MELSRKRPILLVHKSLRGVSKRVNRNRSIKQHENSRFEMCHSRNILESKRDAACSDQYDKILAECPRSILESEECGEPINDVCIATMKGMEGWYCSCRANSTDPLANNESLVEECFVHKRIFTHNRCLEPGELEKANR